MAAGIYGRKSGRPRKSRRCMRRKETLAKWSSVVERHHQWPPKVVLEPSQESSAEAKIVRSVCATTTTGTARANDELDNMLQAHSLHEVLRIGAWMKRFVDNCREAPSNRKYGPLITSEIASQRKWCIVRTQRDGTSSDEFKRDQQNLNLKQTTMEFWNVMGELRVNLQSIYTKTTHLPASWLSKLT